MREITVNASVDEIKSVTDFVNSQLAELGCTERIRIQVDIAIDEIFGNIVRYAYNPEHGSATVRVDVEEDPLSVIVAFIDKGIPFDPLRSKEPDVTLQAKERPIGGLGLFIVKKTMDGISYDYKDGQNILTIRKRI